MNFAMLEEPYQISQRATPKKFDAWSSIAGVSGFQNSICATWAATSRPLGLIGAWN
jgi:hypothetical protein